MNETPHTESSYMITTKNSPVNCMSCTSLDKMFIVWSLVILAGSMSPAAFGNTYQSMGNQRNILPGGRAALLGGAYEAVADDSTATYYNPAGLAFIKERRLQLSATGYRNATTTYEDAIDGRPFKESSSGFFPNFIGGSEQLGPIRVGYAFLTLDLDNIYQQDRYENLTSSIGSPKSYSRTYQEKSEFTWAGTSVAARLTDHFSIGISAFYYQRTSQTSSNEVMALLDGSMSGLSNAVETLNTGSVGIFGLLWRYGSFSIAAVSKLPTPISNRTIQTYDRLEAKPFSTSSPIGTNSPLENSQLTSGQESLTTLRELDPKTHSVGVAWAPFTNALLAGSAMLHVPKNDNNNESLPGTRRRLNLSIGGELELGPLSVIGGYFTNNSLYEAPIEGMKDQPPVIDFKGTTLGSSLNFGGLTGYLGLLRQTGKGSAQIRSDDTAIQPMSSQSVTYIISGKITL